MNKIYITGYSGKDCEEGTTLGGVPVSKFSVASTYRKNKDDRDGVTTWFNVVAFGRLAEGCRSIKKGAHLQIDGRMQEEKYNDKNGVEKRIWKVYASNVASSLMPKREESTAAEAPLEGQEDLNIPF